MLFLSSVLHAVYFEPAGNYRYTMFQREMLAIFVMIFHFLLVAEFFFAVTFFFRLFSMHL